MNFGSTALATYIGVLLALVTFAVLVDKSSVVANSLKDAFDVFDPSVDGFASMSLQGLPSETVAFRRPAMTRKHARTEIV